VGKDSVVDLVCERTPIHRPTSTTTRAPRAGEVPRKHYHFETEEEFERGIAEGRFLEHARVYGQWKGLEREEFLRPLREGRDIIIRTDIQGARTWRTLLEGAVFVFLAPEDRRALEEQLDKRGSEDADDSARRRAAVEGELADASNNDYIVVNHRGRLEEAAAELAGIIEKERANPARPSLRFRG
jgi:guanylate kinase